MLTSPPKRVNQIEVISPAPESSASTQPSGTITRRQVYSPSNPSWSLPPPRSKLENCRVCAPVVRYGNRSSRR